MLPSRLISSHIAVLTMLLVAPAYVMAAPIAPPSPRLAQAPAPDAAKPDAAKPDAKVPPLATPIDRTALRPTDEIRVKLDRLPTPDQGKLAVFVGAIDVTSQIKLVDNEVVYNPGNNPIALGDTDVVVYLVKNATDWQELTKLPIRISKSIDTAQTPPTPNQPPAPQSAPTATPSQSAGDLKITPTLNLNLKSQFSERRTPDAGVAARPTFTDLAFQGGFSTEFASGTLSQKSNFNFLGSTFKAEAIRFGQLGELAPSVDLNEYLIDTTWGPVQFLMGHTCHGNHPFLLNNVCSRGIALKSKLTDRLSLDLSSLRSESIVGFDNIFGIEEEDNNTNAITLGYQIIKTEAGGGLRFETSLMDGSKLAQGDFNEGEIVDAERSKGLGFRITGNDNGSRLKFDAGYARSTFTNPSELDPELTEGLDVVEVEPVTKDAYYLEASYDLFKDVSIGQDRTFSLALNGRYERVNPQFQVLGAGITADRLQALYGMTINLAGAGLQIQHTENEDNLAAIPTILKTRNRLTSLNLNLPLQTIFKSNSVFLPTVTYAYQLNRQFGVNLPIPELSDFDDPSKIPNQVTTNHQIGASWTIDTLNFAYQHTNTFQDNRQIGREQSDTLNISNQITTSWQASPRFQLSLGLNLTDATNFETNITQSTIAPTLGVSWELFPELIWTFNINRSDNKDSLNNNFNRSDNLETILTKRFKILASQKELPGTVFLRYSLQSTRNQDRVFNLNTDATIHVINGGLSLSF